LAGQELVNAVSSSALQAEQERSLTLAENRFLLSLPTDLYDRITPNLKLLHLQREDVLLRAGEEIKSVYFPTTCLVSMVVSLSNGSTIEATTIGSNGYVGLSAFIGGVQAETTAMVQIAGDAYEFDIASFRSILEDDRMRAAAGKFAATIHSTVAQSTACIAFHPVQERLARWLLMVRDCIQQDEYLLTQDFLAIMLGVQRPTVTIAVRILETAGLVQHHRGRIRILDVPGLINAACECYKPSAIT